MELNLCKSITGKDLILLLKKMADEMYAETDVITLYTLSKEKKNLQNVGCYRHLTRFTNIM